MHKDVSSLEKDIELFYNTYGSEIYNSKPVLELNSYIKDRLEEIKALPSCEGKSKLIEALAYALSVNNYNNVFDKLRKIYRATLEGADYVSNDTLSTQGCRNQLTAKQSKWINLLSTGPKSKGKLVRCLLSIGLQTLKQHHNHDTIVQAVSQAGLDLEHVSTIAALAKQQQVNFYK